MIKLLYRLIFRIGIAAHIVAVEDGCILCGCRARHPNSIS